MHRAELVSYYEELSREAEQRRARAEWRAKRLELSVARLQLLEHEAEVWRREGDGIQRERDRGEVERSQLLDLHDKGVSGDGKRGKAVDVSGMFGEALDRVTEDEREDSGDGRVHSPGGVAAGSQWPSAGRRGRQTWAESVAQGGGVGQEGRRTWMASLVEPGPAGVPLVAREGSTTPSGQAGTLMGQREPPVDVLDDPEKEMVAGEEDMVREDTPARAGSHSAQSMQDDCHTTGGPCSIPFVQEEDTGRHTTPSTQTGSVTAEMSSHSIAAPKEENSAEGGPLTPAQTTPQPSSEDYKPHRKSIPGENIHHSVVQEALYGRAATPEDFSRSLSPRLVSSRGQSPPSVAQDIMYGRKSPGMEPNLSPGVEPRQDPPLVPSRGHQPQTTAQNVIDNLPLQTPKEKAGTDGSSPRWRSTRGQAPPSVLQDILYPKEGGPPEAVQRSEDSLTPHLRSTRGQAPLSSAQNLMYPGRNSRGQCHTHNPLTEMGWFVSLPVSSTGAQHSPASPPPPSARHTPTGTTEHLPPPFQPYQNSFPTMGE